MLAARESFEVHLLGLSLGVDPVRPALKLPALRKARETHAAFCCCARKCCTISQRVSRHTPACEQMYASAPIRCGCSVTNGCHLGEPQRIGLVGADQISCRPVEPPPALIRSDSARVRSGAPFIILVHNPQQGKRRASCRTTRQNRIGRRAEVPQARGRQVNQGGPPCPTILPPRQPNC